MEHDSVKNLVEILKSQVSHYSLIRDTLHCEKTAITSWNNEKIRQLNTQKEQISKKEKLLEEARKTISLRIKDEYCLSDDTLLTIIDGINDGEYKDELIRLRDEFLVLVAEISQITTSLKVIYNTNLKIINDIKSKMGFVPVGKYGMDKSTVTLPSALQITG